MEPATLSDFRVVLPVAEAPSGWPFESPTYFELLESNTIA